MQDWTVLRHLSMEGTPHEQLVWKLSMMATKRGLKPAFFHSEYTTIERGEALSDCARRLGLMSTLAQGRELVDLSLAEIARYTNGEGAGMWIYRRDDDRFQKELIRYLQGRSNTTLGALLGYPSCCVTWYEQEVEIPQGLKYFSLLTEDDAADIARARKAMSSPSYRLETETAFALEAAENRHRTEQMCLSMMTFPFVSHVACPSCLHDAKQRSPSAKLNERLSGLALSIDRSLRDSIVSRARAESASMMAHLRERARVSSEANPFRRILK